MEKITIWEKDKITSLPYFTQQKRVLKTSLKLRLREYTKLLGQKTDKKLKWQMKSWEKVATYVQYSREENENTVENKHDIIK